MWCVGVCVVDIAAYYKMKRPTVSNIIRRQKTASNSEKRKRGRKRKITECGMRIFHRYVLDNSHEPLYVILAKFNENTGQSLSVSTGKRYIRSLNMQCYMSIQKPYLS